MLSAGALQPDEMTKVAFPGNRLDYANVLLGENLHRRQHDRASNHPTAVTSTRAEACAAVCWIAPAPSSNVPTSPTRPRPAGSPHRNSARPLPSRSPPACKTTPPLSARSVPRRHHHHLPKNDFCLPPLACWSLSPLPLPWRVPPARLGPRVGHGYRQSTGPTALPADFPDFVREPAAAERIAFLANVPDRWRNVDPWLKQVGPSWTDHFLDVEELPSAGLDPRTVSSFRYDFVVATPTPSWPRRAHPENFRPIDPAKNTDRTRQWRASPRGPLPSGPTSFAPPSPTSRPSRKWAARRRKSRTPARMSSARYGVLGHYVGDLARSRFTPPRSSMAGPGPNPHGEDDLVGLSTAGSTAASSPRRASPRPRSNRG